MADDNLENSRSLTQELLKQLRINSDIADEQREIRDVILDQTNQLKFQKTLKQDIRKATKAIYDISYDIRNESDKELGTARAKISIDKQLEKVLKNKLSLETDVVSLGKENNSLNKDLIESINYQIKAAEDLEEVLKQQQETSQEIRKNFGVAPFQLLSEVMERIGGKASIISEPFADAAKSARESVLESIKQNKKIEERKKLLSELKDSETKKEKEFNRLLKSGMSSKKARKKSGLTREEFKDVIKRKQQIQQLEGSTGKRVSPLMKGFKSLGAGLGTLVKSLTGLLKSNIVGILIGIGKFFVDAMFGASKATADLSKNLLVSREEARGILREVKDISAGTDGIFISSTKYLESLYEINDQLGFQLDLVTGFGDRMKSNVHFSAILKRQLGLSAEAQTRLLLDAEKANMSSEEYTKSMLGRLELQSIETGLQFDAKKTLEEATRISGNLRANYRGSTEALAQAVYQAKVLGFNLQDVEGISRNLLSFQSSIEAEMQAELMTGRQLNLEKAREFALMGKTLDVAKEITNQGITYTEFNKLNILQRDALAKAVGMETDQLADQLQKQEDNIKLQKAYQKLKVEGIKNELGIEITSRKDLVEAAQKSAKAEAIIRKQLSDQVFERIKAQSAQDKFNDTLERAKEAFSRLVDGGALDKLADILTGITESVLFQGYKEEGEAKRLAKQAAEKKEKGEITQQQQDVIEANKEFIKSTSGITGMMMSYIKGGFVGPAFGMMSIARDRVKRQQKLKESQDILNNQPPLEDFIIRPGQKPIKYRKDDIIIGGTNLDGGKGNGRTEQLLERLIMAVEQGQNISVDGNKLNTAVAMNTSKFGA